MSYQDARPSPARRSNVLVRCYARRMSVVPTRQRMIETAVRMFQRGGYHATSWRALVEAAGTPWGSAHHHFPGGKEQLGVAAVDMAAEVVAMRIQKGFAQFKSPHDGVRAFCQAEAASLEASEFHEGCPVATIALETAPGSVSITDACNRAFDRWRSLMAEHLVQVGVTRKRAAELSTIILATFEGAMLVSRVSRTTAPLLIACEQLASLLEAEVPKAAGKRTTPAARA